MTTHGDGAARGALMHEYVKQKPDMVPSIYRLAGVAQAPCRVDGRGRSGPLSLEHTLVVCATSKVTKEDPKFSTARHTEIARTDVTRPSGQGWVDLHERIDETQYASLASEDI